MDKQSFDYVIESTFGKVLSFIVPFVTALVASSLAITTQSYILSSAIGISTGMLLYGVLIAVAMKRYSTRHKAASERIQKLLS